MSKSKPPAPRRRTVPKTERLNVRVATVDSSLFREAAALYDESLSEFIVESGRERAQRLMADRTNFVLDEERWRQFTAALDRPANANPKLAQLLTRARPE